MLLKYIWILVASLMVVITLTSCNLDTAEISDPNQLGETVNAKIARGGLIKRDFKKIGVTLMLPSDVLDCRIEVSKRWQDIYGRKSLSFVICKIPMSKYNRADAGIIKGHVSLFSPEQYSAWKEVPSGIFEGGELYFKDGRWGWSADDEKFDTLLTHVEKEGMGLNQTVLGLDQTVYRMDRQSTDGMVFQAMITRAHYTENKEQIEQDVNLITNILYSVKFLE